MCVCVCVCVCIYIYTHTHTVKADGWQMTIKYSASALHARYLRLQTHTQNM